MVGYRSNEMEMKIEKKWHNYIKPEINDVNSKLKTIDKSKPGWKRYERKLLSNYHNKVLGLWNIFIKENPIEIQSKQTHNNKLANYLALTNVSSIARILNNFNNKE